MSNSSTRRQIPSIWLDWGRSVLALVAAMSEVVKLHKNPQEPVNREDCNHRLNLLQEQIDICNQARLAVGNVADQINASQTLRDIHIEAEQVADEMLNARPLNLDDQNVIHKWHTLTALKVSRLWLAVNNHAVRELQNSADKQGSEPKSTTKPHTKPQRKILAALKGRALTCLELEEDTHLSARTVSRHIIELKESGLVDNSIKIGGYYRPDAPPD